MAILAILKPFLPYIAGLLALLGLGAYVRHDARSDERNRQKIKDAERRNEALQEANHYAENAQSMGDKALADSITRKP